MQNLQEFFSDNEQENTRLQSVFEKESDYMLKIWVDHKVWIKTGAMVAYKGNLKFAREGFFENGVGNFLKKMVTGEGITLTKVEGQGMLYVADSGKKITLLNLEGNSIYVNGNDVLAFEESITHEIKVMKRVSTIMTGGLFNVKLAGKGMIGFTTHHTPLVLRVTANEPVVTDPSATVAWSEGLSPELKLDVNTQTLIGRGSGETIQMIFKGEGYVVIQPYEENFSANKKPQ